MKTSKEVALTICEKIQNEYPKRPLWQTMLEIEDLIDRYVAKQLAIHGVVEQSEQLVCDNHHADLEHSMNYSESICKTCKRKFSKLINCLQRSKALRSLLNTKPNINN